MACAIRAIVVIVIRWWNLIENHYATHVTIIYCHGYCCTNLKLSHSRLTATFTHRNSKQWQVRRPHRHIIPGPLTATGKKRSAKEAEIVPHHDDAKRKERTGSARGTKKGPKVRLILALPLMFQLSLPTYRLFRHHCSKRALSHCTST